MLLSVALATYNEEKNLPSCLEAVRGWVGEIVVADGSSTDKTREIAQKYGARVIKTTNKPIFHINKQMAIDACHGDWILQLDADEMVEPALKKEILTIIKKAAILTLFLCPVKTFFWAGGFQKGGSIPTR